MEMRGRVSAGRLVAAADMPAHPADAQVEPLAAIGEAFGAAIAAGLDLGELIEMSAIGHESMVTHWTLDCKTKGG